MRKLFLFIFILFSGSLLAQEVVTGLQVNRAIKEKLRKEALLKVVAVADTTPVALPFYDDFSANGVFPSALRWIDRYAFENDDYPLNPIDRGAVTLDAINDSGMIYSNALPGPIPFIADHLTSRFIRLDSVFNPVPRALAPADSVYLSFYYEPKGNGSAPHAMDSLIVQFLLIPEHDSVPAGDTAHITVPDKWKKIWATPGLSTDTSQTADSTNRFKRVMIPITDTTFFKKKFRIQFYNYVSLATNYIPSWQSNCCHWNIDQVYLNLGRALNDTIYPKEIRFTHQAPSMLKNYVSMPFTQYCNDPVNEMQQALSMVLTNRDDVAHSVDYSYEVTQIGGSFTKTYDTTINLLPLKTYTASPRVAFFFPISPADSMVFEVKHRVHDIATVPTYGDTITGYQRFYNYYAYDDGTAEAGYGLKGTGAMMAYRFRLDKSPDTLRAVRILFNETLTHANQQFFYLTVWNDDANLPGDTLYSRLVWPEYTDSLNELVTYRLETPVKISGTFYVGTIQTTDDNLNIGLDRNDNAAANLFYNADGNWYTSSISGAPMVRPVIGKPLPLGISPVSSSKASFTVYPNPCRTGRIHLISDGIQNKERYRITISGLTGQELYRSSWTEGIDVSTLQAGIYFIRVQRDGNAPPSVEKLIIMK